jgi:16S rRNA (uracil1498-N3)-methyltransferase
MKRFFFEAKQRRGEDVVLPEEESHHLVKVMRLAVGAVVELLDGSGNIYTAQITDLGRRVTARIQDKITLPQPSGPNLWVGQGILKGEKMDTVMQKCTELGVSTVVPFRSSRCQGKMDELQAEKKQDRWQRISLAACKQSLRPWLMEIEPAVEFGAMLALRSAATKLRLMFWEDEREQQLSGITNWNKVESIGILLGPEGGFTADEVAEARLAGWQTVSLGGLILRAETATLAAVSICQFLAGNLDGRQE